MSGGELFGHPSATTNVHRNGVDGLHLPSVGTHRVPTHVTSPIHPAGEIADMTLFPTSIRKRFVPHRLQVVVGEIDRELLIADGKDARDAAPITALTNKKGPDEEKEATWNRLDALTTFALVGFGFFAVSIGTCAYNRERKAPALRQSVTDRNALWDAGIRVPFGNRICQCMASLACGALGDTQTSGDVLLLSDCYPTTQGVYDSFALAGKKMGTRAKQPISLDSFLRCTKQHVALWCVGFGVKHRAERLLSVCTYGGTS